MPPLTACRICGQSHGTRHIVREMMHGSRRPYDYYKCRSCGCMQLAQDVSISEQYPPEYYAFTPQPRARGLRRVFRRWRNRGVFRGGPFRALSAVKPYPVAGAERWFRTVPITLQSRILDVGCGSGELVKDLAEAGFENVLGIDPLAPASGNTDVPMRKQWLHETTGQFDVIMLHHVLEHMPDQEAALRHIAGLLAPAGTCLIRIPILPNEAWNRYGEHWVQLDAPRHLFIHTAASLAMLADRAKLKIAEVEHDSTEFQFAGSELYARDVPLAALATAYTRSELKRFRSEAMRLNAHGLGDQAAFYLTRSHPTV